MSFLEILGKFFGAKGDTGGRRAKVQPKGFTIRSDLGAVTGGQAQRTGVKVGLAVLLGAVVVGLIVAVVVLATDSGGGGTSGPGNTHATGTPASSGSAPPTATPTTPTATTPGTTATTPATTTATPTTTATTPTTTSPSGGVIP